MTYRIYTEDLNRRVVIRLASTYFDSFTLLPAIGFYRGQREKSLIIEVVTAKEDSVKLLAEDIRRANGQQEVLVVRSQYDPI